RSGKKASLIGEGYYNFSYPGIVLVLLLYGLAARVVWEYLGRGVRTGGMVVLYAIFYKWIWSLSGGGFSELTLYSAVLCAAAVAALWASRSVKPRAIPQ